MLNKGFKISVKQSKPIQILLLLVREPKLIIQLGWQIKQLMIFDMLNKSSVKKDAKMRYKITTTIKC